VGGASGPTRITAASMLMTKKVDANLLFSAVLLHLVKSLSLRLLTAEMRRPTEFSTENDTESPTTPPRNHTFATRLNRFIVTAARLTDYFNSILRFSILIRVFFAPVFTQKANHIHATVISHFLHDFVTGFPQVKS
jgi:hypothetical protein